MSSSQNPQHTVYTPAARQPKFQCSQCIRRFYNRAGLKNHVYARHRSQATSDQASQSSSSLSGRSSSSQHSNNEEEHSDNFSFEIHDEESTGQLPPFFPPDDTPMDVDFNVQLFSDGHDEHGGHSHNDDMNLYDHDLHSNDNCSSPPIIPSSPQHDLGSRSHGHQQTPADNRYIRKVYHDKLNGEFRMYFCHSNCQ
jgi:hypothetical protein